jgi:putative membrane protein
MRRAATLLPLAYGAYLVYAYGTGALYYYIHPIYLAPTLVAGLVLVGLAGIARWESGPAAASPGPSALAAGVLALPVALGFLLPPQPLTVVTAAQRGVDVAFLGGAGEGSVPDTAWGAPPETYTIKDWVKAFQADPEPGRHAGKPARVTGFVYREAALPEGWFLVARFVVKCCAVDAQPVGLLVRAPEASPLEGGRWVRVEGAWEVVELDGRRRAAIGAARVTPTGRPEQPYLY